MTTKARTAKAKAKPRATTRTTAHKRPKFDPEAIGRIRRVAKAVEAGEPVSDADRGQAMFDIRVQEFPFLRELFTGDFQNAPWMELTRMITARPAWSQAAAMVMALVMHHKIKVPRAAVDQIISVQHLWGMLGEYIKEYLDEHDGDEAAVTP